MSGLPPGKRRVCLMADIESYSTRRNTEQLSLQKRLRSVVEEAVTAAGVPRRRVDVQEQGDGLLVLLPQKLDDEPRAVSLLYTALGDAVGRGNLRVRASLRMRLRVAVGQGITHRGANGWSGDGVLEVSRLCDCGPLRAALAENPGRDVGVILPHHLYRDLVEQGDYPGLAPEGFTRVAVELRPERLSGDAWIGLPETAAAPGPRAAPEHDRRVRGLGLSLTDGMARGAGAAAGAAAMGFVLDHTLSSGSDGDGGPADAQEDPGAGGEADGGTDADAG
ncbi:hypothetical protein [Nocardiopsis sp. CC223A]|uniref:hypothetical protein n=1 Tax=Nocardiopsis sp. CC223A TaxID=3044051 RepID=UPI00278C2015|nr:hypothetical protein [Nocardiopsis sp. CC223A]